MIDLRSLSWCIPRIRLSTNTASKYNADIAANTMFEVSFLERHCFKFAAKAATEGSYPIYNFPKNENPLFMWLVCDKET